MEDCQEWSECGDLFSPVALRYEPETWVTL